MTGLDLHRPVHWIGVDTRAIRIPMRLAPRTTVLEPAVIDFAQRRAMIAMGFEKLWQGHAIGQRHPEVRFQIPDPGGVGTFSRHQ